MADADIKVDSDAQNHLGRTLRGRYERWCSERRDIETQWLKNLRQVNGQYDPEVLSRLEAQQSRAYPRITRVKVVSMVSRLMSLLFPVGEKNWTLQPSPVPSLSAEQMLRALTLWAEENPQQTLAPAELDKVINRFAAAAAGRMEQEIDDQLRDIAAYGPSDYESMVRKVVRSAVVYGAGVLKGPMTLSTTVVRGAVIGGVPQIAETTSYRPFFEFVPVWDYYPDLSAKTYAQMDGQFQYHCFSRHQLAKLAERPDFKGEAIRAYLRAHTEGNYKRRTFEHDLLGVGDQSTVTPDGRKYEVVEWWGYVSGHELRAAGVEIPDSKLHTELKAVVWLLDDQVIKAAEDPFPEGANTYHVFVFEEDDVNLLGTGLPKIMRDSQMAVSSAARMLMDNASAVCGPNVEVDFDRLMPGQSTDIKPFKVWFAEGGSGLQQPMARPLSFNSHIPELLNIIKVFMDFADQETFINPLTGGDTDGAGESLRTTGNMSMVLGQAALPFRDVVRNFDRFTVSVIHALAEWNTLFNPRPDMLGDLRPVGRGATSLVAKEIRAAALDQLANTMLDEERDYIDFGALAKHRLLVRDLPTDELLASDEEVKRRQEAKAQEAQAQADQQRRMIEAQIREIQADAVKSVAQAQKHLDAADATTFNAVAAALEKGVDPNVVSQIAQRAAPASVPVPPDPGVPGGGGLDGGGTGAFESAAPAGGNPAADVAFAG